MRKPTPYIRRALVLGVGLAVLSSTALTAVQAQADSSVSRERKNYIVQLKSEPIASYTGGTNGIPATKPDEGQKVNVQSDASKKYSDLLTKTHTEVLQAAGIPAQNKKTDFNVVLNGFSATLTSAEAQKLESNPSVKNVWQSEKYHADTITTKDYLGLTGDQGAWQKQFGGVANAGKGIIVGVLDTGIDSHNPSFAPIPGEVKDPDFKGVCDKGDDPKFECTTKIIGARYYGTKFGNTAGPEEIQAPTDRGGHGSHTAGTAAGNHNVPMNIRGVELGKGSGMAPYAQIAVYKVLWEQADGQGSGDSPGIIQAINDAVADGVDVINYSVSGSSQYIVDPVELAFMHAAEANVFVSASAGNSGDKIGPSSVAHNSPWVTTVAASTHNRPGHITKVVLGNGASYEGKGFGPKVGPAPFIYAADAGLPNQDADKVRRCYKDADDNKANGLQAVLDPAKIKGKIVLCDRGGNVLSDKSSAVSIAGGLGVVLINQASGMATFNSYQYDVPTIHLTFEQGEPIKAYLKAEKEPKATIEASAPDKVAIAPQMADFSSYGPALAGEGNLLKPDITAPGVDIIAPVNAAQDGKARFDSYQGTSMSAPHIAGLAILLKQKYPRWSSMMLKSAMMTTARTTATDGKPIKDAKGNDASPLNYGNGEVQPQNMFDPGLVYPSDLKDWKSYACSIKQWQLTAKADECKNLPAINPSDLNYPSISIGSLAGKQTVTRRVINVSDKFSVYTPTVQAPAGFTATVTPKFLALAPLTTANFTISFERTTAPVEKYSFGSLTWKDRNGHSARSSIALRSVAMSADSSISETGVSGEKKITAKTGYTGTMKASAAGLIPSVKQDIAVTRDEANPVDGTATIEVTPGTKVLKIATYAQEVPIKDIDLALSFKDPASGKLEPVSKSAGEGSDEMFEIKDPKPGTYVVAIDVFSKENTGVVPVHHWLLTDKKESNLTVTPDSVKVTTGGAATFTISWKDLATDKRYLGVINYSDGTTSLGSTLVNIKS